jgi:hypothetical protein
MSANAACQCERLRCRIAATAMEIIAIPPMMPPAMAPAWLPECDCVGGAVALAEEVPAEDVYTPEAPKIAPGPYSGVSISNVRLRP